MYTYLPALQQNIIVDQCVSDSCFMIFYLFCTVLQTNWGLQGDASLHEHDADGTIHIRMCHENILLRIQGM